MIRIYSGAAPHEVAEDLLPLVDFQNEGLSIDILKEMISKRLLPHLMKYDQPGFLSMFNDFPERGAKLGADIALTYNQGVTNWQVSPGGAMLEELCVKALCKLFGLNPNSDATFMYSGTYANQEALYLALHWKAEQEGFNYAKKGLYGFDDPNSLVVLTSSDAHFSLKHAVRMLGLGENSLKTLPVDNDRRIDINKMIKSITELKKSRNIFCVVSTTGTTSSGSIDPILPISRLCQEVGAWLHIDGAYGLAYSLVPDWKHHFSGIEEADSLSWDPHKQLGVPIPNSLLFVRRKEDFNRMALYSDYFNREDDIEPNPGLKSPPSTRPFSALALVTSLRYQGMKKVVERLRSPLIAIRALYENLKDDPEIELCHKPDTGILCFRVKSTRVQKDQMNNFQKLIYEKINSEGKSSVSFTKLDDKAVLRLVTISPVEVDILSKTLKYVKSIAKNLETTMTI